MRANLASPYVFVKCMFVKAIADVLFVEGLAGLFVELGAPKKDPLRVQGPEVRGV